MRKSFVLDELDALKRSPLSWTVADYRLMGDCEYWMRDRKMALGVSLRIQLHGLVRRAVIAYGRRGGECPWHPNYEWKAGVPATDAAVQPADDGAPIVPALRLTLANGETQDYSLSPARLSQVLALLGLPASKEDEAAAVKAQVEAELAGLAFEGGSEIDPNAPEVAPPAPKAGGKRKGPKAAAEGAPL